jgi:hypothetical protein
MARSIDAVSIRDVPANFGGRGRDIIFRHPTLLRIVNVLFNSLPYRWAAILAGIQAIFLVNLNLGGKGWL